MKKRVVSILLVAALTLSLAACGSKGQADNSVTEADTETSASGEVSSDPLDWPVITVQALTSSEMPAEAEIEQKLNEYLISIDAGVQADIVQINFGDMSTQLTLALSDNTTLPLYHQSLRFLLLEILFHN